MLTISNVLIAFYCSFQSISFIETQRRRSARVSIETMILGNYIKLQRDGTGTVRHPIILGELIGIDEESVLTFNDSLSLESVSSTQSSYFNWGGIPCQCKKEEGVFARVRHSLPGAIYDWQRNEYQQTNVVHFNLMREELHKMSYKLWKTNLTADSDNKNYKTMLLMVRVIKEGIIDHMRDELNDVMADLDGSMEVLMEDYDIENDSFPSIELLKPDQRDILTQLGSFSMLAGGYLLRLAADDPSDVTDVASLKLLNQLLSERKKHQCALCGNVDARNRTENSIVQDTIEI